jgi:hypothetical protein
MDGLSTCSISKITHPNLIIFDIAFSIHGALSVSGIFHGAQSQNIGLPNSCGAQLVQLGWLS